MAVQTSYPGVYVQEVPSGVRTITGVSTSVTAFLGSALRGPINRAVTITSFADFTRRYGGLYATSEMSFAVKQFFQNGGNNAIIVRLARNPAAATITLQNAAAGPLNVLRIDAADQGKDGNNIEIRIDYNTGNRDSLFNLTVNYTSVDTPEDNVTENFTNLSMNSQHPRYVEALVNDVSHLINVTRLVAAGNFAAQGNSISGQLPANVTPLVDNTHNTFRIIVDGSTLFNVTLNAAPANIAAICNDITNAVPAGNITCAPNAANDRIVINSANAGENSRIEVLPGLTNDVSRNLLLGLLYTGTETDAAGALRPDVQPLPGMLTSGALSANDLSNPAQIPGANLQSFTLTLDNNTPVTVDIGTAGLPGPAHVDNVRDIATRITNAVRGLRPTVAAFRNFSCTVLDVNPPNDYSLVLTSGTSGTNSRVLVEPVAGDTLAPRLKLIVDGSANTATAQLSQNVMLAGGSEFDITQATQFQIFTGNQALHTGIYALEDVDIFNILCLPGITDPGILSECDAYCKNKRAFLIIDPPPTDTRPSDIEARASGTDVPHSTHAALYYPWIQIANPLNGGALRSSAPSGTIAGVYARTDGTRGVWKAPAGTEATMSGVLRLNYVMNDAENGILNPIAVNCLRIFQDTGAVSWGSRTLAGADSLASEWKYIPVRRTALFIEESLYRGLKWVVFEPNDDRLWAQIRLNVGAFMQDLFVQGAFQGTNKDAAYFVKCDAETTTQNDINLGRVNIWVGFAPLKPAEFVIIYLQQMTGQVQV